MKKINLILAAVLCALAVKLNAQYINVVTPSTTNISANAANMLYDRLTQMVTLNGIASSDNSNKFLLVPYVTVVSIEPTATAPINYVAELEISLYLVDNSKKLIMAQDILTKKGVAANEANAVLEAIKSVKARDPKLKKMIVNGKNRIIEYYNTECDKVIETINTYIEMEMYDEALNELNAIPQIEAELDCYKNSIDILSKISVEQQAKSNDNIKNENPDVSWINK